MHETSVPPGLRRTRWRIILIGFPLYVVGLALLAPALLVLISEPPTTWTQWNQRVQDYQNVLSDPDWLLTFGIAAVVVAVTQILFLMPVVRLRAPQGQRSRSLTLSLVIAVLVAGALTAGLVLALTELVASILTGEYATSPWPDDNDFLDQWWAGALILATLAASWFLWSVLVLIFSRELWADRALGRLVGILLGGTLVELILIIPIDVMVRRRTDCYCETGTFWALPIATAGLIWLAGPGIYFVATGRRRKTWRRHWCERCGHAKGPTPGDRCPECGFRWSTAKRAAASGEEA